MRNSDTYQITSFSSWALYSQMEPSDVRQVSLNVTSDLLLIQTPILNVKQNW